LATTKKFRLRSGKFRPKHSTFRFSVGHRRKKCLKLGKKPM
jgi:hypothetical protein